MYKHSNNKAMTTGAIAAMLSTILYSRRFFPYYVYNIIGGLDEEGGHRGHGASWAPAVRFPVVSVTRGDQVHGGGRERCRSERWAVSRFAVCAALEEVSGR